jgi:hypothetical protein
MLFLMVLSAVVMACRGCTVEAAIMFWLIALIGGERREIDDAQVS